MADSARRPNGPDGGEARVRPCCVFSSFRSACWRAALAGRDHAPHDPDGGSGPPWRERRSSTSRASTSGTRRCWCRGISPPDSSPSCSISTSSSGIPRSTWTRRASAWLACWRSRGATATPSCSTTSTAIRSTCSSTMRWWATRSPRFPTGSATPSVSDRSAARCRSATACASTTSPERAATMAPAAR